MPLSPSTVPVDINTTADQANAPTEVHLLALIHGMWGQPAHLSRFAEVMKETHEKSLGNNGRELDVLVAETNRDSHTYDGVDWGAERVVREIHDRIKVIEKENKKVTRFSLVGYSLGGLLARYAIGILYSQKFFDKVTPVHFATVATPNIGLLRYPTFVSTLFSKLGPIFLSRTGEHFYATDVWEGVDASQKKPLLEVMTEKGGVFYDGLARFKHFTVYANAINDRTVPFMTAAIEPYDPFVAYARTGLEIDIDEKYPPIIKAYHLPEGFVTPEDPLQPPLFSKMWWVEWYNRPSNLPPALQKPFPWNILVYILLPLLAVFVPIAVVSTFSYNVFHSRRRIKLLESTEGSGNRSTIMQLMNNLERGVEDAVVEFMDDDVLKQTEETLDINGNGGMESCASTPTEGATTPMLPTDDERPGKLVTKPPPLTSSVLRHRRRSSITYTPSSDPHSPYYSRRASNPPLPVGHNGNNISKLAASTVNSATENDMKSPENQPILAPTQLRMIQNLNALPTLKKEFVFLDNMRNSHATIVCRDLKRFDFHKRGEGVLRNFADGFEV
ncbi:hypothetical protein FRB95_006151 [Tulasnella sp. JGI-2019a]|nr:hypothetical protein FRB95_006151 [Tulasnella sp. JGI-2019a]